MTDLNLLILFGYSPYGILTLLTGDEFGQIYLGMLARWTVVHQLLCLIGGFLWLGATVSYARRSEDACLYCGRQDGPEGWRSPARAARWGRIAVYVAMVVPIFYAAIRYAWALGIPLGMNAEQFQRGQESGQWVSGALFLGTFALVGPVLMLGLMQRWGEVFPWWMIGLAGRRVPIALAAIPASLVSVLLIVGGIVLWFDLGRVIRGLASSGAEEMEIIREIVFQAGPVLLFPVWGAALVVATLGYYYRRRGPCNVCGRGAQ